jgi:hypothetical protein
MLTMSTAYLTMSTAAIEAADAAIAHAAADAYANAIDLDADGGFDDAAIATADADAAYAAYVAAKAAYVAAKAAYFAAKAEDAIPHADAYAAAWSATTGWTDADSCCPASSRIFDSYSLPFVLGQRVRARKAHTVYDRDGERATVANGSEGVLLAVKGDPRSPSLLVAFDFLVK